MHVNVDRVGSLCGFLCAVYILITSTGVWPVRGTHFVLQTTDENDVAKVMALPGGVSIATTGAVVLSFAADGVDARCRIDAMGSDAVRLQMLDEQAQPRGSLEIEFSGDAPKVSLRAADGSITWASSNEGK